MKKSVAPLILTEPVQGVRKCVLPGFLRLFGNLKWGVTEKNSLIFSRNFYCALPKMSNQRKTRLLNKPLKIASSQRLYFNFHFKIRNVTYMLLWSAPCQVDRKIIKVYDEFLWTRLFIYAGIFNPIDKVILFSL